jgi:hypothetical protein
VEKCSNNSKLHSQEIKSRKFVEGLLRFSSKSSVFSLKVTDSDIKTEGKRSVGRPRHRWEDNIIMDVKGIGFEYVEWVHVAQDRDRWGVFCE